jgi:hypothetical protein
MGLVEMLRLSGTAMLVSDEVSSVIGAIGLIALALSWHKRGRLAGTTCLRLDGLVLVSISSMTHSPTWNTMTPF